MSARDGMAALLAAAALAVAAPGRAVGAQDGLDADLSSHVIAINTGFTGAEVVLFGAVPGTGGRPGDADIVVVVEGPASAQVVREKQRVAGLWVNNSSLTFDGVPSFYALAATRPPGQVLDPAALDRAAIGPGTLTFPARKAVAPEEAERFRRALIDAKIRAGLYRGDPVPVTFIGDRLFRTTLHFPANVPTGDYAIRVILIRDHQVVETRTTPLSVSKDGFNADIFAFSQRRPAVYGAAALIVAVAAGWLAGTIFRRV